MSNSIISKYDKLDILIKNAGVYENEKILTEDGYESTFAVNHLAHFHLSIKLLDLIKHSAPSRIINVSSMAHNSFDLNNLNAEKYFEPYNAYSISKAAIILFTYKLVEKQKESNVTVNALHPGVITTKLLYSGFSMSGASVEDRARTSVYLASSQDLKKRNSASFTYDSELQNQLWEISLKMIKRFL